MRAIIGWTAIVGIVWFAIYVAVQVASVTTLELRTALEPTLTSILLIGQELAKFIRPVLQLALILIILIEAAKRVGLLQENNQWNLRVDDVFRTTSVQGIIAIIIVAAVSIAALGYGAVDALKDLALVVVGFYFGTRRSQMEAEAIATGVAMGASAQTAPPAAASGSNPNPSGAARPD